MLKIETFTCNMLQENCYVVSDETKECVIIDCGAYTEAEKLAKTLRRSTGYELNVVDASTDDIADIVFTLKNPNDSEAYTLDA